MSTTPGPWKWLPEDRMIESQYPVNLRGEYEHICDLRPDIAGNVHEANARLIAAAPDLLDTLQAVLNDCRQVLNGGDADPYDIVEAVQNAALEAIAKATGAPL